VAISSGAKREISKPNPDRARNRKFESICLQRGVRCELNFGKGGFADESGEQPSKLVRSAPPRVRVQIGQLKVENDFLARKLGK